MVPQTTFYLQKRTCGASLCKPQGAEVLRISSDGDDRMGARLKTKKIPGPKIKTPKESHAEFPGLKIFQKTFKNDMTLKMKTLEIECLCVFIHQVIFSASGRCGKSSNCFGYPKNPYLKKSTKFLAKFSYPKKSRNRKFQTQKHPSIIPVTWNLEYPSWWVSYFHILKWTNECIFFV